MDDERACNCGDCRYCNAFLSSEDDYTGKDYDCITCGGGGCTRCEDDGHAPNEIKITCKGCGCVNVLYILTGTHTDCDGCDKSISFTGQVLAHPYGQGEDYAGEVWDDED